MLVHVRSAGAIHVLDAVTPAPAPIAHPALPYGDPHRTVFLRVSSPESLLHNLVFVLGSELDLCLLLLHESWLDDHDILAILHHLPFRQSQLELMDVRILPLTGSGLVSPSLILACLSVLYFRDGLRSFRPRYGSKD